MARSVFIVKLHEPLKLAMVRVLNAPAFPKLMLPPFMDTVLTLELRDMFHVLSIKLISVPALLFIAPVKVVLVAVMLAVAVPVTLRAFPPWIWASEMVMVVVVG